MNTGSGSSDEFELYTKYEYAGRSSAFAAVVPIRIEEKNVLVHKISAGLHRRYMNRERLNELVKKGKERSDSTRLIDRGDMERELVKQIDRRLEERGGTVDKQTKKEIFEEANNKLEEQRE